MVRSMLTSLALAATSNAAWEGHVAATSNLVIGACCLSVALALGYLLRKFRDLRYRGAYLPFAAFLTLSGVAHIAAALGIFHADWLAAALLACTALSAGGTVFLLR